MKFNLSQTIPIQDFFSNAMGLSTTTSDFSQWLHAMKMVAGLPGGMPSEFRKKLWLALADRHLHTRKIDWNKEQIKCLSEHWRSDDEELGIQIVKDLHRTGSSLCSGPMGSLNQAKLKRVLLGYARWNPEIGYCQGFNMLGALILQVMDKNEGDSIKIMILLIEGVLPQGYFCGSLSGLQADMAVFRELLSNKLSKLSKHLLKLQGSTIEDSFEPPLTNVFTMQWFLTLFCTCLPLNCVLRVWDLILIEGSDILLRTALTLWSSLEDRILNIKTADEFYCKMGLLSGEILNGNLIDSNELIQKVIDLGPIEDIKKMREKHLRNISPLKDKKGLMLFYSDDDGDSDDDSRLAVATAWGIRSNRRASAGQPSTNVKNPIDNKERIALDISLLKQQYSKLRERQRQAHIILTAACVRQGPNPTTQSMPINQLLIGRSAILSRKGRRIGPPPGAVPPARKNTPNKSTKNFIKQKSGETLHWKDTDLEKKRRNSVKWKDIKNERSMSIDDSNMISSSAAVTEAQSPTELPGIAELSTSSRKRSESSSYSEDSDSDSSSSTSLCDDENQKNNSSLDPSPVKKKLNPELLEQEIDKKLEIQKYIDGIRTSFLEKNEDNLINLNVDSSGSCEKINIPFEFTLNNETENDNLCLIEKSDDAFHEIENEIETSNTLVSDNSNSLIDSMELNSSFENNSEMVNEDRSIITSISSISQLSPILDITKYISMSNISPLKTPSQYPVYDDYVSRVSNESNDGILSSNNLNNNNFDSNQQYNVNEDGVTNQFFERINLTDRPTHLELIEAHKPLTILNNNFFKPKFCKLNRNQSIKLDLPIEEPGLKTTPILPPCTDISFIHIEKSSQISHSTLTNLIELQTNLIHDRLRFSKTKSVSLDETNPKEKIKFLPSSCPESENESSASSGIANSSSQMTKSSDKVLKIIHENSLILHRILKKNSIKNETDIKLPNTIETDEQVLYEEITPINTNQTINLSETLSSIKNTIKSINMLCDDEEKSKNEIKINIEDQIQLAPSIEDYIIPVETIYEISLESSKNSTLDRTKSIEETKNLLDGIQKFKCKESTSNESLTTSFSRTRSISEESTEEIKEEAENIITEGNTKTLEVLFPIETMSSINKNENGNMLNNIILPLSPELERTLSTEKIKILLNDFNNSIIKENTKTIQTENELISSQQKSSSDNTIEPEFKKTEIIDIDKDKLQNIEKHDRKREQDFQFLPSIADDQLGCISILPKCDMNDSSLNLPKLKFECNKKMEDKFQMIQSSECSVKNSFLTTSLDSESKETNSYKPNQNFEDTLRFKLNKDNDSSLQMHPVLSKSIEKEFSRSISPKFEFDEIGFNLRESKSDLIVSIESSINTINKLCEPSSPIRSKPKSADDNQFPLIDFDKSIKNSIKTINKLCDVEPPPIEIRKKSLDNIQSILDRTNSIENTIQSINRLCEPEKEKSMDNTMNSATVLSDLKTSPSIIPTINLIEFPSEINSEFCGLSLSRETRDLKRDISPRRRRYNNEKPITRDLSLKDREIEEHEKEDLKELEFITNYHIYDFTKKPPPEKPEIRHSTVTCTFYDRFLLQKKEKNKNIDNHPLSPIIISKSYFDSLKPLSDRIIKSAENSPSRSKFENSSVVVKPISVLNFDQKHHQKSGEVLHVRSCDNLVNQMNSENKTSSNSLLPIKKKRPVAEVGLKLGMYKTTSPLNLSPNS